jgi:site-specific recombinase
VTRSKNRPKYELHGLQETGLFLQKSNLLVEWIDNPSEIVAGQRSSKIFVRALSKLLEIFPIQFFPVFWRENLLALLGKFIKHCLDLWIQGKSGFGWIRLRLG